MSKHAYQRDLLDLEISRIGLAADSLAYVTRCRRQGDSWRLMGGELTAKLGRDVGHAWLCRTFAADPAVLAADDAYAAERAARLAPVVAE